MIAMATTETNDHLATTGWARLRLLFEAYRRECPKHYGRTFGMETEMRDDGLRFRGYFRSGDPKNEAHVGSWEGSAHAVFVWFGEYEQYLVDRSDFPAYGEPA